MSRQRPWRGSVSAWMENWANVPVNEKQPNHVMCIAGRIIMYVAYHNGDDCNGLKETKYWLHVFSPQRSKGEAFPNDISSQVSKALAETEIAMVQNHCLVFQWKTQRLIAIVFDEDCPKELKAKVSREALDDGYDTAYASEAPAFMVPERLAELEQRPMTEGETQQLERLNRCQSTRFAATIVPPENPEVMEELKAPDRDPRVQLVS